jgi:hypothetical protein
VSPELLNLLTVTVIVTGLIVCALIRARTTRKSYPRGPCSRDHPAVAPMTTLHATPMETAAGGTSVAAEAPPDEKPIAPDLERVGLIP